MVVATPTIPLIVVFVRRRFVIRLVSLTINLLAARLMLYVSLSVSVMKQQSSCLRGPENDEEVMGGGRCCVRQE